MTKRILASILLLPLTIIPGCGGNMPLSVQTVHAAGTPNSVFHGRYIFQSHGQFADGAVFNEGGTIEADGAGNFTLNSTMNTLAGSVQAASLFHPSGIAGTYDLGPNYTGHAGQPQTNDREALYCTPDGARCTMVSENMGFTWLATLTRD
jgi:hypothetical protein